MKSTHVTKSYNSNHWLEWPSPHQCTSPTELVLGFVCWLKLCFLNKNSHFLAALFCFPTLTNLFLFSCFFFISPFFLFLARENQHPPMHQLVVLSMGCLTYQLTIDPPTYLPTYPLFVHWLNFYPPSKNFSLFLVKPLSLDKTYIF